MAEQVNMPVIPAPAWNATLAKLARKLNITYGGRRDAAAWRHPWNTRARFDPFRNAWTANIQPGMVNAQETDAPPMPWKDAPEATRDRSSAAGNVTPWLSEAPWFAIAGDKWRKIGPDADAFGEVEAAPEFFQALGVGEQPRLDLDIEGPGGITIADTSMTEPEQRRLLRAVDVVLTIPKPSAAPALADDGRGGVSLSVTIQPAPPGNPSIFTTRRFIPRPGAPTLQDQLATGQPDTAFVERLVCTVYLLSPAGAVLGSAPDHSWQPWVRHYLFYNRAFAHKADIDEIPALNASLQTGLAGGAADATVQNQLDALNQADAAASLFLSRAAVEVSDWSV